MTSQRNVSTSRGPVCRKSKSKNKKYSLINGQFYSICKTFETAILNENDNNFPGPFVLGTFEKRPPEYRQHLTRHFMTPIFTVHRISGISRLPISAYLMPPTLTFMHLLAAYM